MNILIAPDSFKGSLGAAQVCNAIGEGIASAFPEAALTKLPLADGGEGTVESLLSAMSGDKVSARVKGPLGQDVTSQYAIFDRGIALMEMASASGYHLVDKGKSDIFHSSTYGTGQMLLNAVSRGCRTIYMGIGGSATNDGGMGFASALGVRFFDADGSLLKGVPENLSLVCSIDCSSLILDTAQVEINVMSDVTNPLLGTNGCARVFAAQKGATASGIEILEAGMKNYSSIVEEHLGIEGTSNVPGAGAAGGLGFGLMAFTGAKIISGIEAILNILNFEEKLSQTDLVITGEGRMDGQSAHGKVASGVASACKKSGIPCIAIVGDTGPGYEEMYGLGIDRIIPIRSLEMTSEYSIAHAAELLRGAGPMALELLIHGPGNITMRT